MDRRVPRRTHTRRHSTRRQLLPAAGLALVFSAGVQVERARKVSADVARQRPLRGCWFPLRGGCRVRYTPLMYSRREFSRLALAAIPASAAFARINSKVHGVQIGVQSYSFRDRSLDEAIKAMVEIGLGECELYAGHVEPKMKRDELRKWRTTVSMGEFRKVRKKFDTAGILLYAYNYSFRDDYTDEEIARGFEMAKALGVRILTASSTLSVVDRVDREAQKAKIKVGLDR